MQIAQCRQHLQTLGTSVGIICILGSLGLGSFCVTSIAVRGFVPYNDFQRDSLVFVVAGSGRTHCLWLSRMHASHSASYARFTRRPQTPKPKPLMMFFQNCLDLPGVC